MNIRRGAPIAERIADLAKLFGVSRDAVERWTKDARAEEKRAVQDRAYDLWLDCYSQRDIAEIVGREYPAFAGITQPGIKKWVDNFSASADLLSPPDSRQHFDICSACCRPAEKDLAERQALRAGCSICAAEVYCAVTPFGVTAPTDRPRHLAEIHAAREWLWPALVQAMLGAPETETAKEIKPWTVRELPDVKVLTGVGW